MVERYRIENIYRTGRSWDPFQCLVKQKRNADNEEENPNKKKNAQKFAKLSNKLNFFNFRQSRSFSDLKWRDKHVVASQIMKRSLFKALVALHLFKLRFPTPLKGSLSIEKIFASFTSTDNAHLKKILERLKYLTDDHAIQLGKKVERFATLGIKHNNKK